MADNYLSNMARQPVAPSRRKPGMAPVMPAAPLQPAPGQSMSDYLVALSRSSPRGQQFAAQNQADLARIRAEAERLRYAPGPWEQGGSMQNFYNWLVK